MVRARGGFVVLSMVVAAVAVACGGTTTPGPAASVCTNLSSVASTSSSNVSLAAAVLPKLAARAATAAGDPVVKIGFIGMLAGKYQNYGVDAKDGVQLAIDKANAAGGVTFNGTKYTFSLDAQDDNADATQGVQAAQKLVDDGVVAVIGG
ncbi:MAG: ABC transporter substrate-binding protein, partial [Candidatus Dormibacteraeota bacterium]|nr:ABC transporter substrate-binding protein [Candidatus Dormibacteraeota bacterium]